MRTDVLATTCAAMALVLGASSASAVGKRSDRTNSLGGSPAFAVTSTLDGKATLPGRIRWRGNPAIPTAQVEEVAFLIDGSVSWVEHKAPYVYSEDDGYLVTTWLKPGQHRFTVRVRAADGRIATDTAVATVAAAPSPPHALAGSWRRSVTEEQARDHAPAGVWTLTFERRWLRDKAPGKWNPVKSQDTGNGGVIDNYWVPRGKTFEVSGSVTKRVFRDVDAEGGWWCEPGGPEATYSWTVRGRTLTLAPVGGHDACADRGSIYTGEWTRVR